jgi:hypothetical protein
VQGAFVTLAFLKVVLLVLLLVTNLLLNVLELLTF